MPKGSLPHLSLTKAEIKPRFYLLLDTASHSKASSCLRNTVDTSVTSTSALFSLTYNFHRIAWSAFIIDEIHIAALSLSIHLFSCFSIDKAGNNPGIHTGVSRFDERERFNSRRKREGTDARAAAPTSKTNKRHPHTAWRTRSEKYVWDRMNRWPSM